MAKLGPVKTYGFKTMFYGTLLPAPIIANKCSEILLDIKKQGHETELFYTQKEEDFEKLDKKIAEFKPDMVAITSNSIQISA